MDFQESDGCELSAVDGRRNISRCHCRAWGILCHQRNRGFRDPALGSCAHMEEKCTIDLSAADEVVIGYKSSTLTFYNCTFSGVCS